MYKKKKYNIYIFMAFILILAGFYVLVFFNHTHSINNSLNRYSEKLNDEYNIIIDIYSDLADIVFKNIINSDSVLSLLELAYGAESEELEDKYRKQLQNSLTATYDDLSLYGVRQVHFHKWNNISFLRMHKPDKYGDDLTGIRASVEFVNRERTPISGFEEGRIFNGYRNVYPLESPLGENLGSVEVSLSFSTVIDQLKNRFKKETQFIMLSSLVEKNVFESEQSNYTEWHLNDLFVLDNNISADCILDNGLSEKDLELLNNVLTQNLADKGKISSLQVRYDGEIIILAFKPVFDFSGEIAGYIFSKSDNLEIDAQKSPFLIITLFFALLSLLAIIFFIYFLITQKKMEVMIQYDQLTHACSRRMILQKMNEEYERFKRYDHTFCIVMMDIDFFKQVNDIHGHAAGDAVLSALSGLIIEKIRNTDFFGRYGGEEFLLILPETEVHSAFEVTESLRKIIAEYKFPQVGRVTVSCGICEMNKSIESLKILLKKSDDNLYKAKEGGRNCTIF